MNLLNTPNTVVWNDIFKNSNGDWIFTEGSPVYIQMPTYVYKYTEGSVRPFSYYVGGAKTTNISRIN